MSSTQFAWAIGCSSRRAARNATPSSGLTNTKKGRALALPFALLDGGNLWKIRIPLPDNRKDPQMPESIQAITEQMQRRYLTNDHWWNT